VRKLRVLLGQLSPILGDINGNLEKIEAALGSAGEIDLAVFPELFLTGYYLKDMFFKLAMTPGEDPHLKELADLAREKNAAIIAGFPEKSPMGYLYNSLIAVKPDGEIFVYRKRHLPTFSVFNENRWFKPYSGPLKPWRLNGIAIGPAICYDMFFPEIFKAYTVMGAKILVVISASPDSSVPLFEKLCQTRALENTSFLLWVNQVGNYDGVGFGGGSMAVSPLGEIIARSARIKEDPKIVELNLGEIEEARYARPILRDSKKEDCEQLMKAYESLEE